MPQQGSGLAQSTLAGSTHSPAVRSHSALLTSWWLTPPAPCPGRSRRPAPAPRGRGPSGSRPSPLRTRASGPIVRTVAPRARSASVSAAAAERENVRSARPRPWGSDAVGFRHSTSLPRRAGAASRFVGLHTPPSTYSRSPICTGAKMPGTEHDASTACPTVAVGASGAPKTTRRAAAPVHRDDPQPPVEARALRVDQAAEPGHRALRAGHGLERGGTDDGAAGGGRGQRDRGERDGGRGGEPAEGGEATAFLVALGRLGPVLGGARLGA